MTLKEKKQILSAIKEEILRAGGVTTKVENIGSIFFTENSGACVLRDQVYYNSKRKGLEYEQLCMDDSYFVGTEAHARALQEAFGGEIEASEYVHLAVEPRDLWVWRGPEYNLPVDKRTPLDLEEVKTVLF